VRIAPIAALLATLASVPSFAEERPTFDSLWSEATRDPTCEIDDHPSIQMVACERELVLWYFTKPNSVAHPGVIRRAIVRRGDQMSEDLRGWHFGSGAAVAEFEAWLGRLRAESEALARGRQAQ
jgi:hypothetical protein